VAKFVKYLPEAGWDVSVLTVSNPSVPLFDRSLERDIPQETVVRTARSWEPGYAVKSSLSSNGETKSRTGNSLRRALVSVARRIGTLILQPDPQVLWLPAAIAEGKRLLRQVRHDAILTSGPPFSAFMIGAALARSARLPLVLDYRDEWTISNEYWENKQLDPLSRSIQAQMQRRVIRAASGLVATTRSSARSLLQLQRSSGGRARVTAIYNGFDPYDFEHYSVETRDGTGLFRLSYIGTLWNLTSAEPLLQAMRLIARDSPAAAGALELVFAGRRTAQQNEIVQEFRQLPCRVVVHDYLEHARAVGLMMGSEALCLFLSDLPGAGRVVPAKLFEYMATGRPILAIAPPGETREILGGYSGGQFSPGDAAGIAKWLTTAVRTGSAAPDGTASRADVAAFTRQNQARQLAGFLEDVLQARESSRISPRNR
jgi:glycosyltransferase involved in cell wall biosynthesis